jgi:energy-converting hydrogenase Eha subunit H
MIIETPYKVGDIVSIKLTSGEEMVATLEKENKEDVILKKPLMLVAGKGGEAGLAPFMFTVDNNAKFTVKLNSIICIVKTAKDAANTYTQSTTSLAVLN